VFDAELAVKRTKLADEVVEHLLRMIRERQLAPGDRLPAERQLAQAFGVSRASLRDAIRRLELLGYVEVRQGNGTIVRLPDAETITQPFQGLLAGHPQTVKDLLEFRHILEPQVAELAALRCGRREAELLRDAIARQRSRVDAGERLGAEDVAFHQLIATVAGNATVLTVVETLRTLLQELRVRHLSGDQPAVGLQQHEHIAEAIIAGEGVRAAAAMRAHLSAVEASLQTTPGVDD